MPIRPQSRVLAFCLLIGPLTTVFAQPATPDPVATAMEKQAADLQKQIDELTRKLGELKRPTETKPTEVKVFLPTRGDKQE